MAAKYKEYEVLGEISPLTNGTRLRTESSTYTTVLNSYPAGTDVEIDLVREYEETVSSEYHQAGDKWGRVVAINGQDPKKADGSPIVGKCWMAIVYLGSRICSEDYDLVPVGEEPTAKEIVGATVVLKYSDQSESEPINMVVENG